MGRFGGSWHGNAGGQSWGSSWYGQGRGRAKGGRTSEATQVIEINKAIKRHGEARNIDKALAAFKSIEEQGLRPTEVSYNVILFALIKCGEVSQATAIYQEALLQRSWKPSVVTLTTLLKGHCSAGDLPSAEALLEQMEQRFGLKPNERTLNTFLRGCLWTGDVERAWSMFEKLTSGGRYRRGSINPDAPSVDYMLRLLATAMRVGEAETFRAEHCALLKGVAAPFVALATAHALLQNWTKSEEMLNLANEMLTSEDVELYADRRSYVDDEDNSSLTGFLQHQRSELQASCADVWKYVEMFNNSGPKRVAMKLNDGRPTKRRKVHPDSVAQPVSLQDGLSRVFLFASTGRLGCTDERSLKRAPLVKRMVSRLESLGLPGPTPSAGSRDSSSLKQLVDRAKVLHSLKSCFTLKGRLKLSTAFQDKSRPLHLEVCAGSGEWIVEQCQQCPHVNWCALELRHLRCASIFSRGMLAGVTNLCVIGGDAAIICADSLCTGSIDCVFVNFPEPPRMHDHQRNDGDHLLDAPFFRSLHALLKPRGNLLMVTDNLPYARVCALTLYSLKNDLDGSTLYEEAAGAQQVQHRKVAGVCLGVPEGFSIAGEDGGSYFDRLWARRSKRKRFFIMASKCCSEARGQ